MTALPSRRASRLADDPAGAFLARMGERSWTGYARSAALTGLLGRRRGASGLALRRSLYPFLFDRAAGPLVCEDVVVRGARRIRLGQGVMLEQHVVLDAKSERAVAIEIGDRSMLRTGCLLDTGYEGWIRIGSRAEVGAYCEFRGLGGVVLGDDCLLARNVSVISSHHVFDDPSAPISEQGNRLATVTIGDGAWLAANVVVLAGVTIGPGAIVGANAVVRDDVPAGAIAVGAPARITGYRPGFGHPSDTGLSA